MITLTCHQNKEWWNSLQGVPLWRKQNTRPSRIRSRSRRRRRRRCWTRGKEHEAAATLVAAANGNGRRRRGTHLTLFFWLMISCCCDEMTAVERQRQEILLQRSLPSQNFLRWSFLQAILGLGLCHCCDFFHWYSNGKERRRAKEGIFHWFFLLDLCCGCLWFWFYTTCIYKAV